jgi:hypothetical protein
VLEPCSCQPTPTAAADDVVPAAQATDPWRSLRTSFRCLIQLIRGSAHPMSHKTWVQQPLAGGRAVDAKHAHMQRRIMPRHLCSGWLWWPCASSHLQPQWSCTSSAQAAQPSQTGPTDISDPEGRLRLWLQGQAPSRQHHTCTHIATRTEHCSTGSRRLICDGPSNSSTTMTAVQHPQSQNHASRCCCAAACGGRHCCCCRRCCCQCLAHRLVLLPARPQTGVAAESCSAAPSAQAAAP